jgi:predicted Fe-Mo cluster-binding NifX family protein
MKIGIPSETDQGLDSMRSGHFGHTPYYTIVTYDDDMNVTSVESVKNVDHDTYGCGGVIEYVMGLGVDGIITAGMGMPPFTRFSNAGVAVYYDVEHPYVRDVVDLFAKGQVARMQLDEACNHHHDN